MLCVQENRTEQETGMQHISDKSIHPDTERVWLLCRLAASYHAAKARHVCRWTGLLRDHAKHVHALMVFISGKHVGMLFGRQGS